MQTPLEKKHLPTAHKWFIAASLSLALFLLYTAIYSTGILFIPTLQQEQWLLHRPITRLDCVLSVWEVLGNANWSIFILLALGLACLYLGYRRRILPYLLLLFLLGIGIEILGKQLFLQPIPHSIYVGMGSLHCPQLESQPPSDQLKAGLGLWWKLPQIPSNLVSNARDGATSPFGKNDDISPQYGYPSGHALRWSFLGLIASWLAYTHIRQSILRPLFIALSLTITLGGGIVQFYIGNHLSIDVVAGDLLGISFACCAIGLLLLNSAKSPRGTPCEYPLADTRGR